MKKYVLAAALVVAVSANAQVEMSQESFGGFTAEQAKASNVEFSDATQTAKYNFAYVMEATEPHLNMKVLKDGNNLEPVRLKTRKIESWHIDILGIGGYFNDHFTYGVGVGAGYEHRKLGAQGKFVFQKGRENKRSDSQYPDFIQEEAIIGVYFKPVMWNQYQNGLRLGVNGTFRLSQFKDTEASTWTGRVTNPDGTVTTSTSTRSNLNVREFTSGFNGFGEIYGYERWGSFGWFFGASCGCQQDIILNSNRMYLELQVYAGISFRLFQGQRYNHPAMRHYNLTESQVDSMQDYVPAYFSK